MAVDSPNRTADEIVEQRWYSPPAGKAVPRFRPNTYRGVNKATPVLAVNFIEKSIKKDHDKDSYDVFVNSEKAKTTIKLKKQLTQLSAYTVTSDLVSSNLEDIIKNIADSRPLKCSVELSEDNSLYFSVVYNNSNLYLDYYLDSDDEEEVIISRYRDNQCVANWSGLGVDSKESLKEVISL